MSREASSGVTTSAVSGDPAASPSAPPPPSGRGAFSPAALAVMAAHAGKQQGMGTAQRRAAPAGPGDSEGGGGDEGFAAQHDHLPPGFFLDEVVSYLYNRLAA
jgi:hypothetical protein